jgi:hypothetical protein
MKRVLVLGAIGALSLGLAGCGSQQAAYDFSNGLESLSVTRDQQYPGSNWDTRLIVARDPECQRRYTLKATGDKFKMAVYRYEPGVFLLNQGKRWYVAETRTCRWQMYDEAPPEPGELIGNFVIKDEKLAYVSEEKKAAEGDKGDKKKADTKSESGKGG